MTGSVRISSDWLDGAKAAADWAHDNYSDTQGVDILNAAIAIKVREEAEL